MGSCRRKVLLILSLSCVHSLASAKNASDVVASAAAVVGSARGVASVIAATTGASLTVTSTVILLLDNNGVAVPVVSVDEQGKELERHQ